MCVTWHICHLLCWPVKSTSTRSLSCLTYPLNLVGGLWHCVCSGERWASTPISSWHRFIPSSCSQHFAVQNRHCWRRQRNDARHRLWSVLSRHCCYHYKLVWLSSAMRTILHCKVSTGVMFATRLFVCPSICPLQYQTCKHQVTNQLLSMQIGTRARGATAWTDQLWGSGGGRSARWQEVEVRFGDMAEAEVSFFGRDGVLVCFVVHCTACSTAVHVDDTFFFNPVLVFKVLRLSLKPR